MKLHGVAMALHVRAIAIPFFRLDYASLPVGILAGLMWVPFSWIIQHWVGIFRTVARTVLVAAAWYLAPHRRFVVIPAVIVGVCRHNRYPGAPLASPQRGRRLRSAWLIEVAGTAPAGGRSSVAAGFMDEAPAA